MTSRLKDLFIKAVSIAVHAGLSEGKKMAIQVATVDTYWSLTVISFYVIDGIARWQWPFTFLHIFCFFMIGLALWLLRTHRYDLGRVLAHLTGLFQIFLGVDATGPDSGYELYYYTSVAVPFITF